MNQAVSHTAPREGVRPQKSRPQRLYRTVWRWHFYAGVCCIPFVIILALSGAIYLFKPQFEAWVDRPYQQLPVGATSVSVNAQIATARAAVPGAQFMTYQLPANATSAAIISVNDAGARTLVYVDPYQNKALKVIPYSDQFMQQVKAFHGALLAGTAGSVIVELAACWAVILVVTGLYLWWPRTSNGFAGVLYPRLRQGRRIFWRDIHAVTGFWLASFTLFLLVSGLPWTTVWGAAFKELRQWNSAPVVQSWSSGAVKAAPAWRPQAVESVDLPDHVVRAVQDLTMAQPVELSVAASEPLVIKASSLSQNRPKRATVWLDGRTGDVQRAQNFAQKGTLDRVIGFGIAAHEGHLFGWFNQLLGVLTTLGLVLLCVSGTILWWRRKPAKRLGAPTAMPAGNAAMVVTGLILALGVALPLVGLSMIAVLLLEWLVLRRIPALRHWLGLTPATNP